MEQVQISILFACNLLSQSPQIGIRTGVPYCASKLFYFYVNRHCPQLKKRYNQVWVILQILFITPIVFLAFPPDKKQFVGRTSEIWPSRTKMVKSDKPTPLVKSSFKSQVCQKQQCCLQCGKVSCTKANYSLHDD